MTKKARPTSTKASTNEQPLNATFPALSHKHNIPCRVLLEDQILVLDNVFTPEECSQFVRFIDKQPLQLTPPKKKGEADRVNHRLSITSVAFAQHLFALLSPHLLAFPYPASQKRLNSLSRPAHSLNSNIRLYKYTPNQHFGQHYDDWVRDTETGAKSEWTLLIYLTGAEDGVEGGETIFYPSSKSSDAIVVPLTRGTVLLHRHGHECLLHEGSEVRRGTKYVLRSDVMFMN
ncbi:hypothetical protein HETIRDRAFT_414969 [Heterobasidion irregulare TC 32-1]|uniref:Fe2OG dioxygenase domain-containing protein n=1 Tax=Heterobasidion irregulare (strain TC 32-1) TaxID=747525 RepID=W4KJW4_HETIT|nr:uncharacterized protein HETIRDRAFT_414969 [Heterobasidion irregulare TC 32-1]ETW85994.1 hypothetical protein HETIRDRAFT_414969 [Heterobasidion irregulare TC 32-1]